MEKEFVPYEESLELKELGFDEPCFGYYDCERDFKFIPNKEKAAPTFSQAFRWFREKYGMVFTLLCSGYYYPSVSFTDTDGDSEIELGEFESYEEAELTCLRKLIEIVKNKP